MPIETFAISSAANDGTGYYEHSAWPPNGGAWTDFSDDASNTLYVSKHFSSPTYANDMTFLRWDTSGIPDTAIIDSATLTINVLSITDNGTYSLVGDYYDFGGEPTVAGDWTQTASPSIFSAVDIGALSVGNNTITLTDVTGISKTGFTGIRLTLSSGTPTTSNIVTIAAFEHANQEPRLQVTYTLQPSSRFDQTRFPKALPPRLRSPVAQ